MKSFQQEGTTIDVAASGTDIASGDVVPLTNMVAVAKNNIVDGESGPAAAQGVFVLPKNATQAMTLGQTVYWSTADTNITTTSAGNVMAGKAWAVAGSADTEVAVAINA